jgi:hypothetical protein
MKRSGGAGARAGSGAIRTPSAGKESESVIESAIGSVIVSVIGSVIEVKGGTEVAITVMEKEIAVTA